MTARHTPRASGGERTAMRDEAGERSTARDAPSQPPAATGDTATAPPAATEDVGGASSGAPHERAPLAADGTRLEFQDHRLFHELLGHHDEHLKTIERALAVRIGVSGKAISIVPRSSIFRARSKSTMSWSAS